MKDLKAFMAKVSEDQGLAKKVMAAKDTAEVVSIAAAAGYKFTEDDLMDEQMSQVAGGENGFSFGSFINGLNNFSNTVNSATNAVNGAVNAGAGAVTAAVDGVGMVADTGKQAVDTVKGIFK